jgi:DNA-binding PadR family transcriptional regulator
MSNNDISFTDTVCRLIAKEGAAMTDTTQSPESFLPLTPAVLNILLALADGEKHGYAIMLEVEANTAGQVKMGPGTLYGSIKRMLKTGLIAESDERPDPEMDDQRRRYYRLTGLGRRVLRAEARRLADQMVSVYSKGILQRPAEGFGS